MDLIQTPENSAITLKKIWIGEYKRASVADLPGNLLLAGTKLFAEAIFSVTQIPRIHRTLRWQTQSALVEVPELCLPKGEIQFIGPSGCGKSVLCRGIATLLKAQQATILQKVEGVVREKPIHQFQRGPHHNRVSGAVILNDTNLTVEDELGGISPSNEGFNTFRFPNTTQSTRLKINQFSNPNAPVDTTGEQFPHTVFVDNFKIIASAPTQEIFGQDTGHDTIEAFKFNDPKTQQQAADAARIERLTQARNGYERELGLKHAPPKH